MNSNYLTIGALLYGYHNFFLGERILKQLYRKRGTSVKTSNYSTIYILHLCRHRYAIVPEHSWQQNTCRLKYITVSFRNLEQSERKTKCTIILTCEVLAYVMIKKWGKQLKPPLNFVVPPSLQRPTFLNSNSILNSVGKEPQCGSDFTSY